MNGEIEKKTTIPIQVQEFIIPELKKIWDYSGQLGKYLVITAFVTGLYVKIFPDLNTNFEGLYEQFKLHSVLKISTLLSALSLTSAILFLLIIVIKAILEFIFQIIKFVWIFIQSILNKIILIVSKILFVFKTTTLALKIANLTITINQHVYSKAEWLAESDQSNAGKYFTLPLDTQLANFETAKATICILNRDVKHWRAGLTFKGKGNEEYIFHAFEDQTQPNKFMTRIVLRAGVEIRDTRKELSYLENRIEQKFLFEIKKSGINRLTLFINNNKVDDFEVPLENINELSLGAWADNNSFKIKFTDIVVTY